MAQLLRRSFITGGLKIASALCVSNFLSVRANAEECVDPQSESMRESLHYTDHAADASQSCKGCGFFTPSQERSACGHCGIMNGPVSATGWCESWSKHE